MKIRVVSDSSSNILEFSGKRIEYKSVPLKIISDSKEYMDIAGTDPIEMMQEIYDSKEKFTTSCPNAYEWNEAFEGTEHIIALTITSHLSGSYSAAVSAAQDYKIAHPECKICVIDTLSTGPEMQLLIEKIDELAETDISFEELESKIREYSEKTQLIFSLQTLTNLVRNGRVNPAVAKVATVLGFRLVGCAKDGNLTPLHKSRGKEKTLETIKKTILELGYKGGKMRIAHCKNSSAATTVRDTFKKIFPKADIKVGICTVLCSFYAELGGILVGFET